MSENSVTEISAESFTHKGIVGIVYDLASEYPWNYKSHSLSGRSNETYLALILVKPHPSGFLLRVHIHREMTLLSNVPSFAFIVELE